MRWLISLLLVGIMMLGCCGTVPQEPGQPVPGFQFPASGSQQNASGNQQPEPSYPSVDREDMIPADAIKMTPELDKLPPILHSDEWEDPVPMPAPVNTRGAEDSAFMMPDGNTIYVWFTPGTQDLQAQLFDNVTGIYVFHRENGGWGEPERIWLIEPGKLALDGCEFVQGNEMWFCSAREGYTGVHLFTAQFRGGKWADWEHVDEQLVEYEVGEMHITADGQQLYYHSGREGGMGGYDIWMIERDDGGWTEPVSVDAVNTEESEGWPFITQDGKELWFTRFYVGSPGVFRSKKVDGEWGEPELILSQFAGESSMDDEGNIYFTHHYYENAGMIEADIYVAYKKGN